MVRKDTNYGGNISRFCKRSIAIIACALYLVRVPSPIP
jgi:hypothetical protein